MTLQGGCLCGAVRYVIDSAPSVVTLCHCRVCRRSTGAQSVTWATFSRESVRLDGESALSWHASSTRARRAFCSRCGTALLFAANAYPDELDVTVGSLDDPDLCPPTCHIHVPSKLRWVSLEPGLPLHEGDSSSPTLG